VINAPESCSIPTWGGRCSPRRRSRRSWRPRGRYTNLELRPHARRTRLADGARGADPDRAPGYRGGPGGEQQRGRDAPGAEYVPRSARRRSSSRGQLVEIGGSFRSPRFWSGRARFCARWGPRTRPASKTTSTRSGPDRASPARPSQQFRDGGLHGGGDPRSAGGARPQAKAQLSRTLGAAPDRYFSRWGCRPSPRRGTRSGRAFRSCAQRRQAPRRTAGGILAGSGASSRRSGRIPWRAALRADKLTLAALVATLRLYPRSQEAGAAIPTLRIAERARVGGAGAREPPSPRHSGRSRFSEPSGVVACTTEVGGGAMPLPCSLVCPGVTSRSGPNSKTRSLARTGPDPVIGRIESGRVLLDLRTVEHDELPKLAQAVVRALERNPDGRQAIWKIEPVLGSSELCAGVNLPLVRCRQRHAGSRRRPSRRSLARQSRRDEAVTTSHADPQVR